MKSLDTHIMLYALNSDCDEHIQCRKVVEEALRNPDSSVVADQVWFELNRLLRNPSILQKPLSAEQAADCISWYRD